MLRRIFGLLVLALAFLPSVRAWEDKGHTIINQLAAEAMPADTPEFFKKAATVGLPYLGPEPDRWKNFAGAPPTRCTLSITRTTSWIWSSWKAWNCRKAGTRISRHSQQRA